MVRWWNHVGAEIEYVRFHRTRCCHAASPALLEVQRVVGDPWRTVFSVPSRGFRSRPPSRAFQTRLGDPFAQIPRSLSPRGQFGHVLAPASPLADPLLAAGQDQPAVPRSPRSEAGFPARPTDDRRKKLCRIPCKRDHLEHPAHDLAATGLGQHPHEIQVAYDGDWSKFVADSLE